MAVAAPPPMSRSVLRRLGSDLLAERTARRDPAGLPRGELNFDMGRTRAFARNPLPVLLELHRRHGPVFAVRILHTPIVYALGPEANHYITVSHAHNFRWRDGHMGDLIPLLGDGLLTIDGEPHRQARRLMLPAFHSERIAASLETMAEEVLAALAPWRAGTRVNLYLWTRRLALRIAMRALFGIDPDRGQRDGRLDAAEEFERALSFYGRDYLLQIVRGPGTPWRRMLASRGRIDRLLLTEIARRRRDGERRDDVMSLLLDTTDDQGASLSDDQVRDQVMTLLFAGHDTTTSTVSFLMYELGRQPTALTRLLDEQDRVLGAGPPTAHQLSTKMPELDMAVDETLRLYPAAWVGPRRAVETFELCGVTVPGGMAVNYCSWASHRLPEVFPDPEAFRPERFSPAARSRLPKGAYVPFGGGSRTCLGMRFGLLEVKAIATMILQRWRLELDPGHSLSVRQMPTLSPRGGLPVTVRERGVPLL